MIGGLVILVFTSQVTAQSVWGGAGDGSTWNDTANWTGGLLPGGTGIAQFGTDGDATPIGLTSSQSLGSIRLTAPPPMPPRTSSS